VNVVYVVWGQSNNEIIINHFIVHQKYTELYNLSHREWFQLISNGAKAGHRGVSAFSCL
jgi:hypothetical protein